MNGTPDLSYKPPTYYIVIRGFQIFLALVIAALSVWIIHGAVTDENAYSLACGILSMALCIYAIVAANKPRLSASLVSNLCIAISDGVLIIFWLASMGASASLRSRLNVTVQINGCSNNGGLTNSEFCNVSKRDSPYLIFTQTGLALLSTIAGLSGLQFVLFIVTCVVMFIHYRHKSAALAASQPKLEPKVESEPMLPGTVIVQQTPSPAPQYVVMQQGPPQHYPSTVPTPAPMYDQPVYMNQQPTYTVPQTMTPPPQQFAQQQMHVSPHPTGPPTMTPPPGQYAQRYEIGSTTPQPQGYHYPPPQ